VDPLCLMLSTVTDVYLAKSSVATDQDTPFTSSTPLCPTSSRHHSNRHPRFIREPHTAVLLHRCKGGEEDIQKRSYIVFCFLWCSGNQLAATHHCDHCHTLTHLGADQVMLTTYYLERLRLVPDQKTLRAQMFWLLQATLGNQR
jgi:hypothetical protein